MRAVIDKYAKKVKVNNSVNLGNTLYSPKTAIGPNRMRENTSPPQIER
jgi:hypothetical protein